jgi:hypothetical protein
MFDINIVRYNMHVRNNFSHNNVRHLVIVLLFIFRLLRDFYNQIYQKYITKKY